MKEEEEKLPEKDPETIVFLVEYIQNFTDSKPINQDTNLWMVPDESFELDLDNNFNDAVTLLESLKIPDITRDNFLARPDEENDEKNQNAYQEDNDYDDEEDDLDIF